jgi:hypothetical protein
MSLASCPNDQDFRILLSRLVRSMPGLSLPVPADSPHDPDAEASHLTQIHPWGACMSQNIEAIRREGRKYACLAAQTEGDTQKAHFVQAVMCDAIAGILEDPEKRASLFGIFMGKPKLRLVYNEPPQ